MDTKDKEKEEKMDEFLRKVQEEQMRLHPEIYEPQKEDTE